MNRDKILRTQEMGAKLGVRRAEAGGVRYQEDKLRDEPRQISDSNRKGS